MEFAGKGSSECTSEGPAALSTREIIYTAHRLQESRGKHQISLHFMPPVNVQVQKQSTKDSLL